MYPLKEILTNRNTFQIKKILQCAHIWNEILVLALKMSVQDEYLRRPALTVLNPQE